MANNRKNHVILIVGKPAAGKTCSLSKLRDQKQIAFLNCDGGKQIPFKNNFKEIVIERAANFHAEFQKYNNFDKCKLIIVDCLTYLNQMYEQQDLNSYDKDGNLIPGINYGGWSKFSNFIYRIFQEDLCNAKKPVIMLAHLVDERSKKAASENNVNDGVTTDVLVPVKGSSKDTGIESRFTVVLAAKKVLLSELEGYKNDHLIITERDKRLGYKYVLQTAPTSTTVVERLRTPLDLFSIDETYIDNDVQFVLDRLDEYYGVNEEQTETVSK